MTSTTAITTTTTTMITTTDLNTSTSFLISVFVFPDLPREPIKIQTIQSLQSQCNYKVLVSATHQTTVQEIKNQTKHILGNLYPHLFPYLYSTIDEVSFQTIHKRHSYLLLDSLYLSLIQPLPCELYLLLGIPHFHHEMFLLPSSPSSFKESIPTSSFTDSVSDSIHSNSSVLPSNSISLSNKKESLTPIPIPIPTLPSFSPSSPPPPKIEPPLLDASIELANTKKTVNQNLTNSSKTKNTTKVALDSMIKKRIDKELNSSKTCFHTEKEIHSKKETHSSNFNSFATSSTQESEIKSVECTLKQKGLEKENVKPTTSTQKGTNESQPTFTSNPISNEVRTKKEQSKEEKLVNDKEKNINLNSNKILSSSTSLPSPKLSSKVNQPTPSLSTLNNTLPHSLPTKAMSLLEQGCGDTTPSTLNTLPVPSSSSNTKSSSASNLDSNSLSVPSNDIPKDKPSSTTSLLKSVQSSRDSFTNNPSSLIPEHLRNTLNLISSSSEPVIPSSPLYSSSSSNNNTKNNENDVNDDLSHTKPTIKEEITSISCSSSLTESNDQKDIKTSLLSSNSTPNSKTLTSATEPMKLTNENCHISSSDLSFSSTQTDQGMMESDSISQKIETDKDMRKEKKETNTLSSLSSSSSWSTPIPSVSPLLTPSITPTLDAITSTTSPSLTLSSKLNDVLSNTLHNPCTPTAKGPSTLSNPSLATPMSHPSSLALSHLTSDSVSVPSTPTTLSLPSLPTPLSSSTSSSSSSSFSSSNATTTNSTASTSPLPTPSLHLDSPSTTLLTPSSRPISLSFKPSNAPSLKAMLNSGTLQRLKAMPSFSPLSNDPLSSSFKPTTPTPSSTALSSPHTFTSRRPSNQLKRPRSDSENESEESSSSSDASSDSSSEEEDNEEENKVGKTRMSNPLHPMSDDSDFEEVRPPRSVPNYVKSNNHSTSKRKKRSLLGSLSQG